MFNLSKKPYNEEEKRKLNAFKTTMALENTGVAGIRRTLSGPESSKDSLRKMGDDHRSGDLKVLGQTPSRRGGGKKRRKSRRKKRR